MSTRPALTPQQRNARSMQALMLLIAPVLVVWILQGCASQKANQQAAQNKYDTVVPVLREYEVQHPQDTVVVENAIRAYNPATATVGDERMFKNKVQGYLQMFGTENPLRKQRVDDLLTAWEMRLSEMEKP